MIGFRTCLILLLLMLTALASLDNFSEHFVLNFINKSQLLNVSSECKSSLSKVKGYLLDKSTLEAQRIFFSQAYSKGPSNNFVNRDTDRWVYRGYECILSAGETVYSKSEHPMHYCYSYDDEGNNVQAYSICIPTPCEDDHVKLLKEWRSETEPKEAELQINYTVCTRSRHEKQWFQLPIPVVDLAFNLTLMMFVIMASLFHHYREDQQKTLSEEVMLAFSLQKNLLKLLTLPKDSQSCITCMFGMRFLSMLWTLVGHSFIFVQSFLENVDEFKDDLVDNFENQWITNCTLSVDTFFILGGTLLSYTWFTKWLKNTSEQEPTLSSWSYWLRFYRHRIVRLWPAYLYTLMAVTLRLSITHFHPMWPQTDPSVQCPMYWYENVLFINSLFNNRCMPWTWYIGTEFIYYLVSPIFLLLLRQRPKVGLIFSVIVIFASAGLNTWKMIDANFPPTQFLWKQPNIFNLNYIQHHFELYIKPQYRIGPYLIGILFGYYLAAYQKMAVKPERSTRFIVTGWIFCAVCTFWGIYGLYPSLQGWNWPIYHLVYGTFHRDVFALGMAWLIYACHTGIGGFINSLLSLKLLLPLSNLCYSVYLFHMIPVILTYLYVPFPIYYGSKWPFLVHCAVQLAISYGFAMICTLTVEYPALNIETILLYPKRTKTTLKRVHTADSGIQLKPPSS